MDIFRKGIDHRFVEPVVWMNSTLSSDIEALPGSANSAIHDLRRVQSSMSLARTSCLFSTRELALNNQESCPYTSPDSVRFARPRNLSTKSTKTEQTGESDALPYGLRLSLPSTLTCQFTEVLQAAFVDQHNAVMTPNTPQTTPTGKVYSIQSHKSGQHNCDTLV